MLQQRSNSTELLRCFEPFWVLLLRNMLRLSEIVAVGGRAALPPSPLVCVRLPDLYIIQQLLFAVFSH